MIEKLLIILAPAAAIIALAVALAPGAATADTIYKCPHGVKNHHYCTHHVKCVVPNVRGDSVGKARKALVRHNCRLGQVERVTVKHSPVKKGHVLSSKPRAHTTHPRNTKVKLFVRK